MPNHDDPLDLDPSQTYHDFSTADQFFDSEHGLFGMSSQPAPLSQEAGSVADFAARARPQAPPPVSLSHLADAAQEHSRRDETVPRPVEGKRGLLISVYTSANILSSSSSRTRVGALRFPDVPDRLVLMRSLLERISLAKDRLHHGIGFEVRSCTFVVDNAHVWIVLIGKNAMSFGKWHKVYLRLGALDIKTVTIHRQPTAGTQSSLDTVADMFGWMTSVEELARNELVCRPPTPEASRGTPGKSKKRKTPVSERVQVASPARKGKAVRAALFTEPSPAGSRDGGSKQPFVSLDVGSGGAGSRDGGSKKPFVSLDVGSGGPSKELVDGCLAFLTSKHMPAVEAHRELVLQYLTSIPDYGHIGIYILSTRPLEQFARAVQLRAVVLRALQERYGIDARASLSLTTLSTARGYERIAPDGQAALRMIGQCLNHGRDFPVFTLLDVVISCCSLACSIFSA